MRRNLNFIFILALFVTLCAVAAAMASDLLAATRAGDADTYIRAGKLLDVRSGKMLANQVIVIQGDKIARIGSSDEIKVPAGAKFVDLSHATVLPGLIDAHEHIFLTGEDNGRYDEQLLKESWQYRTIEATLNAKRDLEAGFTSMRDLETEGAMYSDVDVRNAINRGLIPGPRLEVATRALSTTGGYPLEGYSPEVQVPSGVEIVDGPIEARKAVREQIKYGADLIKIYGTHKFYFSNGKLVSIPTFTLDEVKVIVNEAHREGRKVACHAYGGEGLHNCIDGGVDSIEHGLDMDEAAIQKMVANGIWYVPTLYVYEGDTRREDEGASGGTVSRASVHEVSFRKALAAGVKIAFGTDAGPFPHGTQAKEFEYLTKFGMSPLAAIQTATINAADLMGWSDRVGAIEPGKFADVIAVEGNPLDDITQLERVKFVMKGGQIVRNDWTKCQPAD
ncbi:MAG TPA: amidohydrolase family protein [Candidatus Acidoferrales bacterium]|nr:amidohydrolase family protein [Candidatus Acidoferrales bacterium]